MTAASLWLRAGSSAGIKEQVADVPLPDALENHTDIIAAARSRGVKVLLLTEYVREAQRHQLFDYANMQKSLQAEDVVWYDVRSVFKDMPDASALVDRNHLSRAGNRRLGEALSDQLKPWVYGSIR
tara:strand:- start:80 stop:457 length:378 start_codon:yes stop_codon:yes gene_type:complete